MTVFGLPFHPLIVHATVVVVPVAALAVALAALWPRFRRWAAWGPLAVAALAVALVPLTTSSGESLESALPHADLIETHVHLADGLLPWVIAVLVAAAGLFFTQLSPTRPGWWSFPCWLVVVVTIIAVVAAGGTLVEVLRIGHSGATAAWSGVG